MVATKPLPDESLELRHKVLVIRLYQLAADMHIDQLATVFFIELNSSHWVYL